MNFADVTLAEMAASLSPRRRASDRAARCPGRPRPLQGRPKATLGIRPEDIHIASAADAPEYCFDADVEVVEQLGSEILLDTRAGPALMVASVEPTLRVRAHDKLKLALKPERLHLFDAESEAAI